MCSAPTDINAKVWTREIADAPCLRLHSCTIYVGGTEDELVAAVKLSKVTQQGEISSENKESFSLKHTEIFSQAKYVLIFLFLPLLTL